MTGRLVTYGLGLIALVTVAGCGNQSVALSTDAKGKILATSTTTTTIVVRSTTTTTTVVQPPSTATSPSPLPVALRDPTGTLDWAGFVINPTSCVVSVDSEGLITAAVQGTAVVPPIPAGSGVLGDVDAWVLDSSGDVLAEGTPWLLPQSPGQYNWSIGSFISINSGRPVSCVVQGIDPRYPFDAPQQ